MRPRPPSGAGEDAEVAGVRVGVEHAGEPRALEEEPHEELAVVVALLLGPLADDVGERVGGVEPLGDQHLLAHRHHGGDHDVGVVGEGLGVRRLRLRLEAVVELVGGTRLQLGHERLDVEPREDRRDAAREAGDLAQVGHQRLAGAGVLDLDRDVALGAVVGGVVEPPAAVDLADRRGGGRGSVEPDQPLLPVGAEVGRELLAHGGGGHRGSRVLERGEVLAVGSGQLLGQRRLHHAQHLAELHRAALELAERAEQLLGRALLHLAQHGVGVAPAEALAEADGGAPGVPQGQRRESCRAGRGLAWELGHAPIIPPAPIRARSGSEVVARRA